TRRLTHRVRRRVWDVKRTVGIFLRKQRKSRQGAKTPRRQRTNQEGQSRSGDHLLLSLASFFLFLGALGVLAPWRLCCLLVSAHHPRSGDEDEDEGQRQKQQRRPGQAEPQAGVVVGGGHVVQPAFHLGFQHRTHGGVGGVPAQRDVVQG